MKSSPTRINTFLLAACTSTRKIVVEPIEPAASLPIEHVAHLSAKAWPPFGPEDSGTVFGGVTERKEIVEVDRLVVELPREAARQILSRCETEGRPSAGDRRRART